jgi:signal transduction histidine kinase
MRVSKSTSGSNARFRLSHVFLAVNLLVLLVPLGSFFFFRIYENELVKKTELELISQAALTSSLYIHEIRQRLPAEKSSHYGVALPEKADAPPPIDPYFTPITPRIELSHTPTLPPRPDGIPTTQQPDTLATDIGTSIAPILSHATRTTLSGIMILDHHGIVIASQQSNGLSFAHIPEIQTALQGNYASALRISDSKYIAPALTSISRGTGVRVFVAMPIIDQQRLYGVVYLSRTPQSILKHLAQERGQFSLAVIAILVLTLCISILTSYAITKPIRSLISYIQHFTAGNAHTIQSVKNPRTQEVAQLNNSFINMATSLQQRMHYIRTFATHVSHEFKTPLTSIRGAAELILDHQDTMPTDKRNRFLNNIIHDTDRLKSLVTQLLQLAKADTVTPSNAHTHLEPLLHMLQSRYADRGLHIDIQTEPSITLPIETLHLETILTNLCDNAVQHHATHCTITSVLHDETIELILADNGEGIPPVHRDKIFTPFFTTRREQGGTGLGLGIVQSLLEAHHATITLDDNTPHGLVVRMIFANINK